MSRSEGSPALGPKGFPKGRADLWLKSTRPWASLFRTSLGVDQPVLEFCRFRPFQIMDDENLFEKIDGLFEVTNTETNERQREREREEKRGRESFLSRSNPM